MLLTGAGVLLIWAAVKDENPVEVVVGTLTGARPLAPAHAPKSGTDLNGPGWVDSTPPKGTGSSTTTGTVSV